MRNVNVNKIQHQANQLIKQDKLNQLRKYVKTIGSKGEIRQNNAK
jgi:hypothetical protein